MIFVVNDACLLIDLIDIDLLDEYLQLNFQTHITSSVLGELDGEDYEMQIKENISKAKILLYNLTATEQNELESLMAANSARLSEPDCSCLYLAIKKNWTILTCEKLLTRIAKENKIKVHGSLWVLDQLVEFSIITPKTAYRKLVKLMSVNKRMPDKECQERLQLWDSS